MKVSGLKEAHMTQSLMTINLVVIAILLAVCPIDTFGQHQHSQDNSIVSNSDAEMIDGSVHPELIPDLTAYRLYLVAISEMPNPTDEQNKRQLAHLGKIGFGTSDLKSAITVFTDFKVQYTALIANYNASTEAALRVGATTDVKAFLAQRDELVQVTRDKLKALITPEGMARMDKQVQSEKKQMRVSAKEGQ
jgi:hypothetical protein